ncbi:hypothetical protein [Vibrio ulleungensis]|uniref:Uncharacterized protein n=1 Tax=Vibrio ulleungensis TaxID=2807619 RepID=A0ABS2HBR5_9VIBR|nr:hypothetical protein [Vibrio ulleungensis]MBM7035025.1 hypothetical protein [Vibrio ulleungensis]
MTDQIKDTCKYLDGEYPIHTEMGIPVDHPSIAVLSDAELAEADTSGWYLSTACWRNYVARWAVKNGQLFLEHIDGKYQLLDNAPLLAHWFTGELELPYGKFLGCNLELGYQLCYSHKVSLNFEAGKLVSSRVAENTQ